MIKETTMGRSEKFEYCTLYDINDTDTESHLNDLGVEGWELVTAFEKNSLQKLVLKRALEQ